MDLNFRDVNEQSRTYIFGDGDEIVIRDVVRVAVSNTTHRLETASGVKYIIPDGWLAIRLDGLTTWSF